MWVFFYSDHRLVWAKVINTETIIKGPGLWVMNNSILKDNVYKKIYFGILGKLKTKKGNFINVLLW